MVTSSVAISEQLRFIIKTTGAGLPPFDSWLILRGIKTLGVRMEKAQENAFAIVHWLEKQKEVKKVIYPGIATHPQVKPLILRDYKSLIYLFQILN